MGAVLHPYTQPAGGAAAVYAHAQMQNGGPNADRRPPPPLCRHCLFSICPCCSMDPKFLRNQRYAKKHNVVAESK